MCIGIRLCEQKYHEGNVAEGVDIACTCRVSAEWGWRGDIFRSLGWSDRLLLYVTVLFAVSDRLLLYVTVLLAVSDWLLLCVNGLLLNRHNALWNV